MIRKIVKMKNNIRQLRAIIEISQEDLANDLDVTRQTIIAIEKGKYNPSLPLAFKIALYFSRRIEDIFIFMPDENEFFK